MFNGYNENFPYAYVTDRLVRAFPTWSKIRKDRTSVGAQFLNVTGLQFVEIDSFLEGALHNQYVGTANIGEVSYIFKVKSSYLDLDTVATFIGTDMAATPSTHTLAECHTLFEFYSAPADAHVFIIDFQSKIIYFRQEYSLVKTYSGDTTPILIETFDQVIPHHVWNVFDEFALLLGLNRRYRETNEELKERVLDVFRFPGNSTRLGLIRAIGRELGLVYKGIWQADAPSFVIDEVAEGITITPETIIVNNKRIQSTQYQYDAAQHRYTIYPRAKVFFDETFSYSLDNVRFTTDKHLVLNEGYKEGFMITPIINPSNLKSWDTLQLNATGDITVDVVRYDFETYANQEQAYYVKGLRDGESIIVSGSTPIDVEDPIRLIVNMKRALRSDPSPHLIDITLTYIPAESEVACIHDVGLQALHEDQFRNSLFDVTGAPIPKLVNYVNELNDLVPIMWSKWKWDESYWDVVGKNLIGLHVLPSKWDPRLGEISNIYFQSGIGFGLDCLVRFDKDNWSPMIHGGYYYISIVESITTDGTDTIYTEYPKPQFINVQDSTGKNYAVVEAKLNKLKLYPVPSNGTSLSVTFSTENYFYANPVKYHIDGPVSQFVLMDGAATPANAFPMQGAPVIIDVNGVTLKQVAFLDEDYNVSITNSEKVVCNNTNKIAVTYADPINITVSGGYTVQSVDENIITLDNVVTDTQELTISYKVNNSFIIEYTETEATITMSGLYADFDVVYESKDDQSYWQSNGPSFDPVNSHITSGFLFITNQVNDVADLEANCEPDVINGNGVDITLIIVDVVDKWGNPVLNQTITTETELVRDDTQAVLGSSGTVVQTGTYYNRKIYSYKSPNSGIPLRVDGSGRNVPCTANITFTCGNVEKTVSVKVR
jgi:hypothetical protein